MVKKEVKKHINPEFLLNLLYQGKTPSQISKEYNLSKQLISYYLRTLKANGNIIKKGYGVWEVKDLTYNTLKKQVKGHAYIWVLQLKKDFDWSKFNLRKLNNVYQIIINNKKIWLSKRKVTIYENKDFYGFNSIEARKLAIIDLLKDLDTLQRTLNIKLGNYGLKVTREHYSLIKNELAEEYNKRKEKMVIRDDFNKEWLWIDFSDQIDELETNNLVISKQLQDWWNDNKKHNFQVTPSFLMESINKVTQNQLMFADNLKSHISAIQELASAVHELRKEIKQRNIKDSYKPNQKELWDF